MGNLCYKENKNIEIVSGMNLSQIKEEKDDNEVKDIKNNNIIIFNFQSRFDQKKITGDEEHKIKNKNTIKNINRRASLINKLKLHEDKLEKFIKFTHTNKIISSTTNSFFKQ